MHCAWVELEVLVKIPQLCALCEDIVLDTEGVDSFTDPITVFVEHIDFKGSHVPQSDLFLPVVLLTGCQHL